VFKFLKFIVSVTLCVHIMGCFWFMSARIDNFSPDCWVVRRGILDSDIPTQYLNSIYWAFTTVTTVGYGDITALTQLEMILSISWMITGVGFYSFTIGSLSSFLSAIDTRDSIMNAKLAATHEFAKETGITSECKRKITAVVTYNTQKVGSIWSDKHSLFTELPKHLRYEVALSMYNGIAAEIPFFKNRDHAFVVFVMPTLKPLKLTDSDYVYKEGDFATEVYLIIKGRVNFVLSKNEIEYKSFLKGSYIGEVELLFKTQRLDNVMSCGNTEFLTIAKRVTRTQDFFEILEEFPAISKDFKKIAREKAKRNRQTKKEVTELLRMKNEGGSLGELAGKRSIFDTAHEVEPEVSDDDEKYQKMLTDVKSTSDSVYELRGRMNRLDKKIDELLNCFKGVDKPGTQASLISKLIKRKRLLTLPR
jgi:hyperpolarization activated cyclic nucleotide-gated potassium channel 1